MQRIISPLGLALLCLLLIVIFGSRRPRLVKTFAVFVFILLLIPSVPLVSEHLLASLENASPIIAIEQIPPSQVIVVLGGTAEAQWGKGYYTEEIAGSRLLMAKCLYQAQRKLYGFTPQIIVSSGIKYRTSGGAWRTEAEDMRDILQEMGVNGGDILLESQANNTAENAEFTAKLLARTGIPKDIVLVTSAYHMPRAQKWFRKSGIDVYPLGAGRSTRPGREISVIDYLPSATALQRSSAALKEYLGLAQLS